MPSYTTATRLTILVFSFTLPLLLLGSLFIPHALDSEMIRIPLALPPFLVIILSWPLALASLAVTDRQELWAAYQFVALVIATFCLYLQVIQGRS
jgi:hypothetical protein